MNGNFSSLQFQILLEKFLNLGESQFEFICFLALVCRSVIYYSFALLLSGDDRNIVEVFVAGRKVVPFAEPSQKVL